MKALPSGYKICLKIIINYLPSSFFSSIFTDLQILPDCVAFRTPSHGSAFCGGCKEKKWQSFFFISYYVMIRIESITWLIGTNLFQLIVPNIFFYCTRCQVLPVICAHLEQLHDFYCRRITNYLGELISNVTVKKYVYVVKSNHKVTSSNSVQGKTWYQAGAISIYSWNYRTNYIFK